MNRRVLFGACLLIVSLICLCSCERGGEEVKQNNIKLYVEEIVASPEGDKVRFNYSVVSPIEGETLKVECDAAWVTDIAIYASFVDVSVSKNDSGTKRTAELKCKYGQQSLSLSLVHLLLLL